MWGAEIYNVPSIVTDFKTFYSVTLDKHKLTSTYTCKQMHACTVRCELQSCLSDNNMHSPWIPSTCVQMDSYSTHAKITDSLLWLLVCAHISLTSAVAIDAILSFLSEVNLYFTHGASISSDAVLWFCVTWYLQYNRPLGNYYKELL